MLTDWSNYKFNTYLEKPNQYEQLALSLYLSLFPSLFHFYNWFQIIINIFIILSVKYGTEKSNLLNCYLKLHKYLLTCSFYHIFIILKFSIFHLHTFQYCWKYTKPYDWYQSSKNYVYGVSCILMRLILVRLVDNLVFAMRNIDITSFVNKSRSEWANTKFFINEKFTSSEQKKI